MQPAPLSIVCNVPAGAAAGEKIKSMQEVYPSFEEALKFCCNAKYISERVISQENVLSASVFVGQIKSFASVDALKSEFLHEYGLKLLLASVMCSPACVLYTDFGKLEDVAVRHAVALDRCMRDVLSCNPIPINVAQRLAMLLVRFMSASAEVAARLRGIQQRGAASMACIYRNAVLYSGDGDAAYHVRLVAKYKAAMQELHKVGGETTDGVVRLIADADTRNEYLMMRPGSPKWTGSVSFARTPPHAVMGFCQLAERCLSDVGFAQSCPADETDIDDYALLEVIRDDLVSSVHPVFQRVVKACTDLAEEIKADGVDIMDTPLLPKAPLLHSLFTNGKPLSGALDAVFGAVVARFYYTWEGGAVGKKRRRMDVSGVNVDITELDGLFAELPEATFTDEELKLLKPVLPEGGIPKGVSPASLARAAEVRAEWEKLRAPLDQLNGMDPALSRRVTRLSDGAGVVQAPPRRPSPITIAKRWIDTILFIRRAIRAARIDHGNRRIKYIRLLIERDRARLCKYLRARALVDSTEPQRVVTTYWFTSVAHYLRDAEQRHISLDKIVINWLCSYVEKVNADPGFGVPLDLVLFPAHPPAIPHWCALTPFIYRMGDLASVRSDLISVAIVAGIAKAFESCLPESLPGLDAGDAMKRLVELLGSSWVRGKTISALQTRIIDTFWPQGQSRLGRGGVGIPALQKAIAKVIRTAPAEPQPGEGFRLGDRVDPEAARYVVSAFASGAVGGSSSRMDRAEYVVLLPNADTRGLVDRLLGDATRRLVSLVRSSRDVFSSLYTLHLSRPLEDSVAMHSYFLRRRCIPAPYAPVDPSAMDTKALLEAFQPLRRKVHDVYCSDMVKFLERTYGPEGTGSDPGQAPIVDMVTSLELSDMTTGPGDLQAEFFAGAPLPMEPDPSDIGFDFDVPILVPGACDSFDVPLGFTLDSEESDEGADVVQADWTVSDDAEGEALSRALGEAVDVGRCSSPGTRSEYPCDYDFEGVAALLNSEDAGF